jgi:mRNA interferase RelE/StbE
MPEYSITFARSARRELQGLPSNTAKRILERIEALAETPRPRGCRKLRGSGVPAEDWDVLIEWLETIEDVQVARSALGELEKAGGDRERAGWLRWEDVRDEM